MPDPSDPVSRREKIDYVIHHQWLGGEFIWRSRTPLLTPATEAIIAAAVLTHTTKGSPE